MFNCGNMLFGVGVFVIENGLIAVILLVICVCICNVNMGMFIEVDV